MEIVFKKEENNLIITPLIERIDINSSIELKKTVYSMIERNYINLILNFKEINFIDSNGLAMLIAIFKKLKIKNGNLKIINTKEFVREVFGMTKLSSIIKIV